MGGLVVEPSYFSRNHFVMEPVHTHTRFHLYTKVLASSSQTKLTLRVLTSIVLGHLDKEGQ